MFDLHPQEKGEKLTQSLSLQTHRQSLSRTALGLSVFVVFDFLIFQYLTVAVIETQCGGRTNIQLVKTNSVYNELHEDI